MVVVVASLLTLVSLVCLIMVVIKIFGDAENGGVGKGIFGIICGLYALIWGWQNAEKHNIKTLMMIWTVVVIITVVFNLALNPYGGR